MKPLNCLLFSVLAFAVLPETQAQDIIKRSYRLDRTLPVESRINKAQVIRFSREEIAVLKKTAGAGPSLLNLSIDGYQWPLRLAQQNAELAVRTSNGQLVNSGPALLTGKMQNGKGNVRLAVNDHFVYGFLDNDTARYFIEPLRKFDTTAGIDEYIFYDTRDASMPADFCGVTEIAETKKKENISVSNASAAKSMCSQVRMAVATDYSVYQRYQSVETIVNYIVSNWHVTNTYFHSFDLDGESPNDIGDDIFFIPIVSIYIVTEKANDILPNNSWSFRAFTEWAAKHFAEPHEIAQLVTNRIITLSGPSVAGVASVGSSFCAGRQAQFLRDYLLSAWAYSLVSAHETGHNLGCDHDIVSLLGGKIFIMAATGLNASVTRFSRAVDHSDTSGFGSHAAIEYYYRLSAGCLEKPCEVYSCGPVNDARVERVNPGTVKVAWKGNASKYLLQYKVYDSANYSLSNSFELTEPEKIISDLSPCTRYEFLIRSVCDEFNVSPPVIIPY